MIQPNMNASEERRALRAERAGTVSPAQWRCNWGQAAEWKMNTGEKATPSVTEFGLTSLINST
jgi:hypothetical protein